MKIKKEFKGFITEDGDDGFCWGIHFALYGEKKIIKFYNTYYKKQQYHTQRKPILPNPIEWLDEIAGKYPDKKVKVKIEIEIDE